MGFSVSGATAVVFIGLLVSTATLYPAADAYAEHRVDALESRNERALMQQNTGVELGDVAYDTSTDTLTIEANNTGATTLSVTKLDLLVDGTYTATAAGDVVVAGSATTGLWAPGEQLTITLTRSTTPDRVKLVTGPGVSVTARVAVV